MKQYQGKLSRTYTKVWNGVTLYSFTLYGVDIYFRTGREPLAIKEGSFIEFEADGQDVKPSAVKLITEPQVSTEPPAMPSPPTSTYWENRQKGDSDRQKAITYQAARKDAIAVTGLCASATGGDLDVVLGLIDDLTVRFAEDTERLHPETPGFRPKKIKAEKVSKAPAVVQQELNLG